MRALAHAAIAALVAAAGCSIVPARAQVAIPAAPAATPASSTAPGSRTLPLRREAAPAPDPDASVAWIAGAVLLALIAAAGAVALSRRGMGLRLQGHGGGALRRLSSQGLTPQASVHVVRWRGQELLLACTSQQVSVIARKSLPAAEGEGT